MGTEKEAVVVKGLEGVYVKESKLCLVDGERGRLLYVGYDIRDLAERSSFEETCYLLWHFRLPGQDELETTRRGLAEERKLPKDILNLLKRLPKTTVPIDALRTAVSALAAYDPALADLYSDVVAGIATLKGPLHGGANEQAVKMLLKIGSPANAEPYVEKALARGEKIPGFGHRVYKNFDPRALILRDYAKKLTQRGGDSTLLDTASAVQEVML